MLNGAPAPLVPLKTLPARSTFPGYVAAPTPASAHVSGSVPPVELAEAAARRHMVRSFSGAPPEPAVVDRLLRLALRAPSAGNTGGWDAVVLEGPEQIEKFWLATTTAEWRQRSPRWPGLRRAPVAVVLYADPGAYLARYGEPDKASSGLGRDAGAWPIPYWHVDTGMAVLLLLLGAVDLGLAACFLGNFRGEDELRQALGVPGDRRYLGAVLIGEAGDDDAPSRSSARRRRSPEEVFHRGCW